MRKKYKSNEVWTETLCTSENFSGCISNISEALNSINSTVQLLNSVNKETYRQSQLTNYTTRYELVTETDISTARLNTSREVFPQCSKLLFQVQGSLHKLKQDEVEYYQTLKKQTQLVQQLKRNPKTVPILQEKQSSVQRRKELEHKIKQLEYLARLEEGKNATGAEEVKKIKVKNDELSKETNIDLGDDLEERRLELEQVVVDLQAEEALKTKQTEKRKEISNIIKPQSDTPHTRDYLESKNYFELVELYRGYFRKIQEFLDVLKGVSSGRTIECESECKKYIQGLRKEKMMISDDDRKKGFKVVIEQVKNLCYKTFANQKSGKTVGRVLELILLNGKVTVEELSKEFLWTEEDRHNLKSLLLALLQVNMIAQDGNNFVIET